MWPKRSFTVKENHIGSAVSEILRQTQRQTGILLLLNKDYYFIWPKRSFTEKKNRIGLAVFSLQKHIPTDILLFLYYSYTIHVQNLNYKIHLKL